MIEQQTVGETRYMVVVNVEDQYSIWLESQKLPIGWRDDGKVGTKAECVEYISQVWTDMRPRSLREVMARQSIETLDKEQGSAKDRESDYI